MLTRRLQLLDGVPKLALAGLSLCLVLPARSLAAGPPPVIIVQPTNQTVLLNDSVTFTVEATSGTKLSYQWFKDGVKIAKATDSAYSIASVNTNDAGIYMVKVTNAGGTVTSSNATLKVITSPVITQQPQSQTVARNTEARFEVATIGVAPLGYQWFFNGAMIAGATNSVFTIARVKNTDAGNYTVIVTNSWGSVTSDVARLTVVDPAAIILQPQSQSAIEGQAVSFSVTATGTAPLFYQWSFNGAPLAGATNSVLDLNPVQMNHAGNYQVLVWNPWSAATSAVATLTVGVPPAITTELQDQNALVGQSVTLSVTATGTDPLGYSWLLNGNPLPEANSPTLTLNNVQLSDAGKYAVVVTNCAGAAMSTAMLSVIDPAVIVSPVLHSAAMTPEGFTFQFEAPVGHTFVVLASRNLRDWTPIATNEALTSSVAFTDAAALILGARFYRVLFRVATQILEANPISSGNKIEIKLGQKGAQSFRHGVPGQPGYWIHKVVLRLSREPTAPDADLQFSIGTAVNAGPLAGSAVSIAPSSITDLSGGNSFQTYEISFGVPVGPLVAGTTYFLNLECEASNGKPIWLEYSGADVYPNGDYFKDGSPEDKDVWFEIWGMHAPTAVVTP